MAKKVAVKTVRNKEKSKQKLLDAVGEILKDKGFGGLKVNNIAVQAGLDKKLIYRYFGGTNQLIDEYISTIDYWSNVKSDHSAPIITDGGQEFAKEKIKAQFDYTAENEAFRKLLLWTLSEEKESLSKLLKEQESNGELLFQSICDPHFGNQSEPFRAIVALLVSGSYYLNLFANMNGRLFCGIDLKTEEGKNKIKQALDFIIDMSYEKLQHT